MKVYIYESNEEEYYIRLDNLHKNIYNKFMTIYDDQIFESKEDARGRVHCEYLTKAKHKNPNLHYGNFPYDPAWDVEIFEEKVIILTTYKAGQRVMFNSDGHWDIKTKKCIKNIIPGTITKVFDNNEVIITDNNGKEYNTADYMIEKIIEEK